MSITIPQPVAPIYSPALLGLASVFTPMAAAPFVVANARRTGTGSVRALLGLAVINLLLGATFGVGLGLVAWPVAMAATYVLATKHPSRMAAVVADIPETWLPGFVDAIGSVVCGALGLMLLLIGFLAIPTFVMLTQAALLFLF